MGGVDGLDSPYSVTLSADYRHLYVAGSDAVVAFSRFAATGCLTFVEVQRDGVDGIDGLEDTFSVTVSPDGNHLYAAGSADDAVAVFSVVFAALPTKCQGMPPTDIGASGNHIINDTSGNYVIHALGGYDVILGMGGTDVIYLGDWDDFADGGPGKDRIYGENGDDDIPGGDGKDRI